MRLKMYSDFFSCVYVMYDDLRNQSETRFFYNIKIEACLKLFIDPVVKITRDNFIHLNSVALPTFLECLGVQIIEVKPKNV